MKNATDRLPAIKCFLLTWGIPFLRVALLVLAPALVNAAPSSGQASGLAGSLRDTNNDLLDFLTNDVATLCMIVGGIFAAATHIFNNGQGTKFFLSVFACGVLAMAFTQVLALARGLALSVGN